VPKRIVDGEALWTSGTLKLLPKADALALFVYCWLLPIAESNGVFEFDVSAIHARTMQYHDIFTEDELAEYLKLYNEYGLLFIWQNYGKQYGFWVNINKKGRLPKAGQYSCDLPNPPVDQLNRYISSSRKKLTDENNRRESLYKIDVSEMTQYPEVYEKEEDNYLPSSTPTPSGLGLGIGLDRGREKSSSLAGERSSGTYKQGEFSYADKKPDKIYSIFVEKWETAVGAGAVCKKPHQQGWTWFVQTCEAAEADTLVPAFELWSAEHADPGNHTPIGDFLRNLAEYTQRLVQKAPENALEALGREESIRKDIEAAKAINDACRAQETQGESIEELLARAEKQLD
jgi:hypothetical protein